MSATPSRVFGSGIRRREDPRLLTGTARYTADIELNPGDNKGQSAAHIEGFRRRGIHPKGVISLAE